MRRSLVGVPLVLFSFSVLAEEWMVFSARSRGMGGTGVALPSSPSRINPATAGVNRTSLVPRVSASFQAAVQGNLLAEVDDIADRLDAINLDAIQGRLNAGTATAADLRSALQVAKEINDLAGLRGGGVTFEGGVAADLGLPMLPIDLQAAYYAYGGAGFDLDFSLSGAAALTDGGVAELLNTIGTGNAPATSGGTALSTRLDGIGGITAAQANEIAYQAEQAGLDLSDESVRNMISDLIEATDANNGGSSGNTFSNNASSVTLDGIALKEAGVTGAIPLGSRMRLGLTLKSLEGTTFARTISYRTIQDGESLSEEIDDRDTLRENTRTSTEFDFDAGVQVRILPAVWVGVSGRNLASPEFPFLGGSGNYTLAPQVRAGIAFAPLGERLVIAAEGDVLTNTSDALPGFRSRQGAVGVEFAPFQNRLLALALRGGARQDREAEHDDIVYSTGLGLNLLGVNLALAADIAADKTDIEKAAAGNGTSAEEIPSAAGLTVEVGWGRRF